MALNGNNIGTPPFSPTTTAGIPQLASPPTNAGPGFMYFDTTLGYALVLGQDGQWHGVITQ